MWSSTNTIVATVGTGGLVTGVAAGTTTISYTVTNSCGIVAATATVTVNPAPAAGTITGPSTVAVGSSITLTDAVTGGTWSAGNADATVTGGVVLGVTAGAVNISYTVTNGCGSATAIKLVTVGSSTVTGTLSPITEVSSFVCIGSTDPMWDYTPGGTWSIAPASVATISATGVVSGVGTGIATVTYTLGGAFATAIVTVFPTPAAITGSPGVCQGGGTTVLSDATPGGVWSSSIPATATIGAGTGLVTGTNPGTVTMYYTLAAPAGCRSVVVVTVNPVPSTITGPIKVCTGSSILLSDAVSGGTWSGTNAHASIDPFGNVIGLTAGTVIFTYTTGTGCFKPITITVNQSPAPISGSLGVCSGNKIFVSDSLGPVVSWTSSNTSVAIISASGAVLAVAPGTTTITYTPAGLCTITAVVTVYPTPAITAILGPSTVSHGGAGVTLSDLSGGGIWTSNNTAILTVGSTTGHVTAIVSVGSTYINYTITNSSGCVNAVSRLIGTSSAPHTEGGSASTSVGATINIADEATGGEWSSGDNNIAIVDNTGTVTGITAGNVNITHTVINADGSTSVTRTDVAITALPMDATILPNPNKGTFTVKGRLADAKDEVVFIEVTSMLGQVVYSNRVATPGGIIMSQVELPREIANGMYLLKISSGTETKVLHFVIE